MRKKERNYEVKINGIPQLNDMPKDLLCFSQFSIMQPPQNRPDGRART